jgi:Domain of unknown function (DUF4390)
VKRSTIAFLVVASLLAPGAHAEDDKPEVQRMRFIERGDDLTVSTTIPRLFDTSAYDALENGFQSTVVIRMWVYPRDSTEPVAFKLIQRTARYDPWDENFVLRDDEHRQVKVKRKSDALKLLTSVDDVPIARLAELPYDQVFLLAMVVELNPVSKETLAEVRRWVSQSPGGGLDRGGAFFGSFVSVFVNPKIPEADRVLRIRSQPFYRPRS